MKVKAQTLNKDQKKNTLSAKKRKLKKEKSVLTTTGNLPPKISFKGSELSAEECSEFELLMLKYNQYTPTEVKKWNELKNLTKDERKKLRVKTEIPSRKFLALGFNEVSRSIENKSASIIIMSGEISPKNLNLQLYQYSDYYKIPLIKILNLKEITKKCFGFSSMAMSLVGKIPPDQQIYKVFNYLNTKYIEPFKQSQPMECIAKEVNRQVKKLSLQTEKEKIIEETPQRNLYLHRSSTNTRTFVPQPRIVKKDFNSDFICIDVDDEDDGTNEEDNNVIPFPDTCQMRQIIQRLKIKKIRANANRRVAGKK